MYELMKEDMDWFEMRLQWYMQQGESKQAAMELAADEVVQRIYGQSNEECKAERYFWAVMRVQEEMGLRKGLRILERRLFDR